MFVKNKKTAILIVIFFIFFLVIAFTPQMKNVKGKSTPKPKKTGVVDNTKMSEKEKGEYHLVNPFTENDLMPFSVQSDTAIAFDSGSGEILYSKFINTKAMTASISKIMTALIALENIDAEEYLPVSKEAADMIPNKIVMNEGELIKVDDLLYGLMMISANDAAEVLAEGVFNDRDKFIDEMNKKAEWLGLKNTSFVTPSGLDDPNHLSTPYDLGVITRYALKEHPNILEYMGKLEHSVFPTETNESHWWQHISSAIRTYPGMDGVKTGYTWDAGNTFLGTALRGDKRVVVIIFNSQDASGDVTSLFDYSFKVLGE